jgi:hypothetical protein
MATDYNSFVGKQFCRKGEAKSGLVYTVTTLEEKTHTHLGVVPVFALTLNVNPDAAMSMPAIAFEQMFEPAPEKIPATTEKK